MEWDMGHLFNTKVSSVPVPRLVWPGKYLYLIYIILAGQDAA